MNNIKLFKTELGYIIDLTNFGGIGRETSEKYFYTHLHGAKIFITHKDYEIICKLLENLYGKILSADNIIDFL